MAGHDTRVERRTMGVFALSDISIGDLGLLDKATRLMMTAVERDDLEAVAGPVFTRVIDKAKVIDRYGVTVYGQLPAEHSIYMFEWDARSKGGTRGRTRS